MLSSARGLVLPASASSIGNTAIIGGGLAGLSCAYWLSNIASSVTVFDLQRGPGLIGASSTSAGLLHPLTPRGKLIWKGLEGYTESLELLRQVQRTCPTETLNDENVTLLRPFRSADEKTMFSKAAKQLPNWLKIISHEDYQHLLSTPSIEGESSTCFGAAIINGGLCIDSPLYLRSLWSTIQENAKQKQTRCTWEQKSVDKLVIHELSKSHDLVIVAAGPGVTRLWDDVDKLNLKLVRGQNLLLQEPQSNPSSQSTKTKKVALLAGEYIVPRPSDGVLICGATHEYSDNISELEAEPNAQICSHLLSDKINNLRRGLMDSAAQVVGCTAGIRVVTPRSHHGKIPFIRQHKVLKNTWTLGGFGSRGLIWHALLGKMVVEAALAGDTSGLPVELIQDVALRMDSRDE